MNADYKHSELTERIIGLFYEVYNELGYGFLESVYEEAFSIALRQGGLEVSRRHAVPVWFRGEKIGNFNADLVVSNQVLVELKATRILGSSHEAQLLHYLRATEFEIRLLLNFGQKPQIRRLAFDNSRKKISEYQRKSAAKGFSGGG